MGLEQKKKLYVPYIFCFLRSQHSSPHHCFVLEAHSFGAPSTVTVLSPTAPVLHLQSEAGGINTQSQNHFYRWSHDQDLATCYLSLQSQHKLTLSRANKCFKHTCLQFKLDNTTELSNVGETWLSGISAILQWRVQHFFARRGLWALFIFPPAETTFQWLSRYRALESKMPRCPNCCHLYLCSSWVAVQNVPVINTIPQLNQGGKAVGKWPWCTSKFFQIEKTDAR